jgi:hypothetical protein
VNFGLGLLREDRVGLQELAQLRATSVGIPLSASLTSHVRRVRTQPGSSCVGMALAAAIEVRASVLGQYVPDISGLSIYTMAREAWGTSLADVGCRIRDAVDALQQRGVVSEDRWPSGTSHLNELLPWDVFQHGLGARVEGLYRVSGVDAIRAAIAAGHPVAFGMTVDQAYFAYQAGVYVPGGDVVGGHMQLIVGYEPWKFRVLNSWGSGWGEGGCSWLADADVASGFEHCAIRLVPPEVA